MSRISVKQVISGTLVSALMVIQLPAPVWAATDPSLSAAVTAGTKYLAANQNGAGMIGAGSADNDWSVIAMKAAGQDPSTLNSGSGVSAVDFMIANAPTETAPATDIERRILAINAVGKDSSNFGGIDYNALLKGFYKTKQFGDPTLLNDDYFGIIAAAASHDNTLKAMAQGSLDFVISQQQPDGGFSYTTDTSDPYYGTDSGDTAAAIVALEAAKSMSLTNPKLSATENNARAYILTTQQADGGFGSDIYSASDGSTTSWCLIALNAIGPSANSSALSARNWLEANQNTDGGFAYGLYGYTTSDARNTAPAILALLGTTWLLNPAPVQITPSTPTIPAPIVPAAAPTAAAPTPAPTPGATVNISQPVALPTTDLASAIAPITSAPTGEVKGASQIKPVDVQSSKTSSTPNYSLYGVLALLAIAAIWYMIQSTTRKKV